MGRLYYCRGNAAHVSPFTDWQKALAYSAGSKYSQNIGTIGAFSTLQGGHISPAGLPQSTFWESSGTWTYEAEQSTAYNAVTARCRLHRLNSSGVIQESGNYSGSQTMTQNTKRTFTMVPPWGGSGEVNTDLIACELLLTNPGPVAATNFGLYTNVYQFQTGLTEYTRGTVTEESATCTESGPIFINTFSDSVTATEDTETYATGLIAESVTCTEANPSFIHTFSERVYATERTEDANYGPLKDVKPDVKIDGWHTGTTNLKTGTSLVPMAETDRHAMSIHPSVASGSTGYLWRYLDADVDDLTDKTHYVIVKVSLAVLPVFEGWVETSFSSVPVYYGEVDSYKIRFRYDFEDTDPGTYPTDVDITVTWDGGSYEYSETITEEATDEIFQHEVTGVSLSPIELNSMKVKLAFNTLNILQQYTQSFYIYALDLKLHQKINEKIIPETTWPVVKPISEDFSGDTKDTGAETWDSKENPTSDWTEG